MPASWGPVRKGTIEHAKAPGRFHVAAFNTSTTSQVLSAEQTVSKSWVVIEAGNAFGTLSISNRAARFAYRRLDDRGRHRRRSAAALGLEEREGQSRHVERLGGLVRS